MTSPNEELVFAPLGGVGEIGMNLSIYGLGSERHKTWLAVDLGVSFASEEHLPGVDLILPDIRYLVEERRNLVGLVLTHAHEDHFGALFDLWPQLEVPVYATPFTAALLQAKRESEPGAPDIPVKIVPLGGRIKLGPFDVELVSVAHSIPESNALIIRTRLGTVLHTGDWKIDPTPVIGVPTDEAKLRSLGERGRGRPGGQFHQRHPRRPLAVGDRRRQDARRAGRRRAWARRGHHLRLQRRPHPFGRARRPRGGARGGRGRARHGAHRSGGTGNRIPGRASRIFAGSTPIGAAPPTGWWRCAPAARASRAPRSPASPRRSIPVVTLAQGRPGDLLLAHDPGQREGGRPRHQRADPPGHRGHHRPHPPGACLRPSAARRDGGDVRLGQAESRYPGAWRGAASRRARRVGARARHRTSRRGRERRRGPAGARARRDRRRGAGGAPLQGRPAASSKPTRAPWRIAGG